MLYEKQKSPAVLEDHREIQDAQKLLEKKQEIIILADEMNSIKKELSQQEETEPEPEEEEPKEKEEHLVPLLFTPTPEQEIQIFTDDIPVEPEPERKPLKFKLKLRPELKLKQSEKRKVKHENRICIKCGEELEKNHVCKEKKQEKKELEIVVMTDDIPFQTQCPQPLWVEES
jgi:hypothetical protein